MSNLIRHAILKNNVVINIIEYPTVQTGCPEGLKDVIAVASDVGQIGWIYADGIFTNPNPSEVMEMPVPKSLTDMILESPTELAKLKQALGI